MFFNALQFLFWRHKHNQKQNTTLNFMNELLQLVYFYTVWFKDNYGNKTIKSFSTLTNVENLAQYETLHTS